MPTYKLLFIWVEGDDDERFFNRILSPKFQEKYDTVKIIKYAKLKKEKVDNFIKSIKAGRVPILQYFRNNGVPKT